MFKNIYSISQYLKLVNLSMQQSLDLKNLNTDITEQEYVN